MPASMPMRQGGTFTNRAPIRVRETRCRSTWPVQADLEATDAEIESENSYGNLELLGFLAER